MQIFGRTLFCDTMIPVFRANLRPVFQMGRVRVSDYLCLYNPIVRCQEKTIHLATQQRKRIFHLQNGNMLTRFYSDENITRDDILFKPVYRFSHIVFFRLICRLKIYQTGLVCCSVPYVYYLHETGAMSTSLACSFSGIVSLAAVMLCIMGEFFRRVVGIISVNQTESKVQISHLTFWGRRRNIIVETKDIVPLSDSSQNVNDVYIKLQFYNKDSYFYLFHKHGVLDSQKFLNVIG